MRGDVEATGSGRQMELPLGLQVAFGVRPERARGDAPAIVCNAIDLHHSCHDFPASLCLPLLLNSSWSWASCGCCSSSRSRSCRRKEAYPPPDPNGTRSSPATAGTQGAPELSRGYCTRAPLSDAVMLGCASPRSGARTGVSFERAVRTTHDRKRLLTK